MCLFIIRENLPPFPIIQEDDFTGKWFRVYSLKKPLLRADYRYICKQWKVNVISRMFSIKNRRINTIFFFVLALPQNWTYSKNCKRVAEFKIDRVKRDYFTFETAIIRTVADK